MRRLVESLDRLRFEDAPVLICGETGSGKELAARILHQESRRAGKPFLVVDAAAIPEALIEVELFGARAGAFTGSEEDRDGMLARAAGGTVLVEGVAELPLTAQAKLLRVLSAGAFRPLGGEEERPLEARFLFSSARDLAREVEAGRFRRDLLHRIDVVRLELPPLRERSADLPALVEVLLAEAFAESGAQRAGAAPPRVERSALDRLTAWPWPGNVRELKNLLTRILIDRPAAIRRTEVERALADPETGTTLFPAHLLSQERLRPLKRRLERDYIVFHLRRLRGDSAALCRFLGLSPRQLYRRTSELKIDLRRERRRGGKGSP
jgi:DNA-binding NtrC family response regulator